MTHSVTMTTMSNRTTSSPPGMSSDLTMSHTPSSVRMSYTASAVVTPMSYNSSVWPTRTDSVLRPFVCTGESCRQEIECTIGKLNIVVSNKKNSEYNESSAAITEVNYRRKYLQPVITKARKINKTEKLTRPKAVRPYLALIMCSLV